MSTYNILLILLFVILLAVAVALFLPIGRSRTQPGSDAAHEFTGLESRNDDRNWLAGLIYYNPDDPDLIVPKRLGYGWTINFGHPRGKLFLIVLIALIVLPFVLLIFVPGLASYGCHPSGCHLLP
ncbi:MAG TPA: DUF5808 domain-containing protein [Ktedonobacterales bacterium]|nr:DUF5808 domain-containing protein [Ktedonobacterales bacterium]